MGEGSRRWTQTSRRETRREAHEPTFLLGMGAHLAGTTALHRYLSASPQCEPGAQTEYHVLDSAGLASETWVRESILDRAAETIAEARATGQADGAALLRAAMVADPACYFDYFAGLLSRPGTRLTMDLTPDHSMLSAPQLAAVREGFETRGVRTAAVFVMRDPLDRVVTHVRLLQRQRPEEHPGSLEDCVEELYAAPAQEARTRYDQTVTAIDRAFEPARTWFGFHESLMSPDSLRSICRLTQIDEHEPDLPQAAPRARWRSASRTQPTTTAGLRTDLARKVVGHYQDVYDFVADRFCIDDVSGIWPSAQLLR